MAGEGERENREAQEPALRVGAGLVADGGIAAEIQLHGRGAELALLGAAAVGFEHDAQVALDAGAGFFVAGGVLDEFGVDFGDGGVGFGVQQAAEGIGLAFGPAKFARDDVTVDAFEDAVQQLANAELVEGEFFARAQAQRVVQEVVERAGGELFQLADAQTQVRAGRVEAFSQSGREVWRVAGAQGDAGLPDELSGGDDGGVRGGDQPVVEGGEEVG